ncbi:MAG: substrate-binding domain-containing protein [Treponemataceae bacterium]
MKRWVCLCSFFLCVSAFAKGSKENAVQNPIPDEPKKKYTLILDKNLFYAQKIKTGFLESGSTFRFETSVIEFTKNDAPSLLVDKISQEESSSFVLFVNKLFDHSLLPSQDNITEINIFSEPPVKNARQLSVLWNVEKTAQEILKNILDITGGQGDFAFIGNEKSKNYMRNLENAIKKEYSLNRKKYRNISLVSSKLYNATESNLHKDFEFLIQTYPKIKAIISLSSTDILQVASFIEEKNMTESIFLTGIADQTEAQPFFDKKIIASFIDSNFYQAGFLAGYLSFFFSKNPLIFFNKTSIKIKKIGEVAGKRNTPVSMFFYMPTIFHTATILPFKEKEIIIEDEDEEKIEFEPPVESEIQEKEPEMQEKLPIFTDEVKEKEPVFEYIPQATPAPTPEIEDIFNYKEEEFDYPDLIIDDSFLDELLD